jgi:hypothetical protein
MAISADPDAVFANRINILAHGNGEVYEEKHRPGRPK